ncbi:cilia- and flagella-associated protein 65 isoform X1 [Esox lucius]|uniref:cilia- and flagella-associated protein 65 isoform X1 n=1 Tax=Esox lucius TaxID=8010 RepID=UPI0010BDE4AC|nr:cilia- and flagella-associated protein 65 isoform X1 [Esox lucius]XP_034144592.1 cilia- and flagella-associated protein 65 isoform X1 [Esox lucius]
MSAEVMGNSVQDCGVWTDTPGYEKKGLRPDLQCPGALQGKMPPQRCCFLGVETRTELRWENWKLGGEFTKTLLLKNVHSKLQKLRFRSPVSKFFTTLFPQMITLSPGTSFSLPITFRPLDRCDYQDSIEFQSNDGSFTVTLSATLPRHALDLPESVLVPPCAVLHQSQTTFMFRNISKLQTWFQWEVSCPFQLSPERGVLQAHQECQVTVLFRPQEALVYQVEASCVFGEEGENSCTVLLQGLSKYPFLQVNASGQEEGFKVLEFGSVPVGSTAERHLEILNPCSITTSFSVSRMRHPALSESLFQCSVQKGELAPRTSIKVPVLFTPLEVDSSSVDYLSLRWPGALSKTLIKVTGACIGPRVTLSSSVLDFGCVEEGQEAKRSVVMVNSSSVEARYQFDLDASGNGVFSLEPAWGVLPANSSQSLKLTYRPQHPIGHHRRLACLLLHREPLFLDLLGTCHSEQQTPATLRPRHLVLYQKNWSRGLTYYPPDVLSAMLAEGKLQVDQEGALLLQEYCSQPDVVVPEERSPMEEYYQDCAGGIMDAEPGVRLSSSHITVDPPELTFYNSSSSSSQSVTVYNHTKGKLSLFWTSAKDSTFSVSPWSCDLGPLKSTSFRVSYTPRQQNTFHGAQLECFALYKVLRDFTLVDERTLCPSWCVTVRVSGHSFQPDREHFIPRLSLQRPQVVFPPLSLVSYRTVLLENLGDLPLVFRLDPEECPSVSVRPTSGLVLPGQHQILTLRAAPAEHCPVRLPISLHLNSSPRYTQQLRVVSVLEKPRVCLEGDGSLFFKPTAVGSCSQRPHRVRNLSSLPLRFLWRISGPDRRLLSVEPETGVLLPNDTMVQTWSFTPSEEMVYNLKPKLTFWPIQMPGCRKSRLPLKVVGMASKGSIQAECAVLALGEVLVGDCRTFQVPLMNNSTCPVTFSLTVLQRLLDGDQAEDVHGDPVALELDSMRGTIPAQSRLLIRSTVRPARRARYCWELTYQTLSSAGCVLEVPQPLCQVQAEGVFPTLEVTDGRCAGSMEGLSKLQLWSLFSLDHLNSYLKRDPAPPELTYRVPTRHSLRRCPSVFTSAMLDFDFSAAPLGSAPSSVLLMFENTGNIPVEWSFLFPEDQQIELEYWAETGEFSSTELHQMKVQDNRLFNIEPRSGKLQPGQQRAVSFTYRHDFTGPNRLPVLFKLSHGREILLNFMGVTVLKDKPYLRPTSTKHVFAPVAIGGFSPPKQVFELYNGGAVPLTYLVDTDPLEQLTADNFGHPVLQCLTRQGEVQPGRTALLEWVFYPLEAKTYSVDLPITVLEGDTLLMTFEGCGFDEQVLAESAPVQLMNPHMSVPSTQRLPLPDQVVYLSEERVSIGDIPVCSRSTRILFLTNVSHTDRVLYAWNITDQAVLIQPDHGTLAPGETSLCVLTLLASGSPSFYQLDLICEVTLEEAVSQYHQELQRWEQERERQNNEFTITEKDLQQTGSIPLGHTQNTQECDQFPQRPGPAVRKYKTLPPIRGSSSSSLVGGPCSRPSRAERRAQREASKVWRKPEPPRPSMLHLGVTARSHSLLEFQAFFPTLLSRHHVNSLSQAMVTRSGSGLPPADIPHVLHGPEREILTHVITSILRNLLDDPQFHLCLLESEAVPYYAQLTTHGRASFPTPPAASTAYLHGATPGEAPPPSPGLPPQLGTGEGLCGAEVTGSQIQEAVKKEHQLNVQETIRRLPEFCDLAEEVLLNTIQNLMVEAFLGELVLTARPRIIALPPVCNRRTSCGSARLSRAAAGPERSRETRGASPVLSSNPTNLELQ